MIKTRFATGTSLAIAASLIAVSASMTGAQALSTNLPETFAGSINESYVRYMQTLAAGNPYPIGIRNYSLEELDSLKKSGIGGPWAGRLNSTGTAKANWGIVGPTISTAFNSAFPFGGNDGAEWKGKGLTTFAQGGIWFRWRGLSAIVAPVAFRAENKTFEMLPNGQTGRLAFSDGSFPKNIDRPQRFGAAAYSRLDPGESYLRVDANGVAAGISTSSQWWGPASEFPIVLGNNAGGFPHVFAGTSRPVSIGIGTLHARLEYGFLAQSPFSPVSGSSTFVNFQESGTRRFMAGIVALLQVRGIDGFEIGGTRFFHAANSNGGVTAHNLLLPFQGLLKSRLRTETDTIFGSKQAVKENQLASLFLRVAPPRSGIDLYVEFGREDHSADFRDLMIEPDHSSLTTAGFRKAWNASHSVTAVRGEVISYDIPSGVRTRLEGDGGAFTHSILRQGHTQKGQLLSADVGPGAGNGQIISVEQFRTTGRWGAYFRRAVSQERSRELSSGAANGAGVDVLNTIGFDITRFHGSLTLTLNSSVTLDINRNFSADKTNLGGVLTVARRW